MVTAKREGKYKVFVNINGSTYTYTVDTYEIDDDGLLKLYDEKIQKFRRFDPRVCEIQGGEIKFEGKDNGKY